MPRIRANDELHMTTSPYSSPKRGLFRYPQGEGYSLQSIAYVIHLNGFDSYELFIGRNEINGFGRFLSVPIQEKVIKADRTASLLNLLLYMKPKPLPAFKLGSEFF